MHVREIVKKFGGQTVLAGLLGIRQNAVAYWVKKGLIPSRWHTAILLLAGQKGIDLQAADLVTMPEGEKKATSDKAVSSHLAGKPSSHAENSPFLFYASDDGTVKVQVLLQGETVWASQRGMADIFNTSRENITMHLRNIFDSGELTESTVCKDFLLTAADSKNYKYKMYNLDAIISVGYRVNSYQATQFRKWATTILKEYLIKGFVLDDERLKQGSRLFGQDYFDELLERIREIRASERRFHQKMTDIYSQCSIDYDKDAPVTRQFYAHIQDKLHYAIHGQTSAELIGARADSSKLHMGLTAWKNEKKGGKLTRLDVTVGKNYLNEEELDNLNRLVSMYLDFAENMARRKKLMTMQDWADRLDGFLKFNDYDVLSHYGTVKREQAERYALAEFEKFRIGQDQTYESDFDKVVDEIKIKKRLPGKGK